ncbi:hypothetical protein ScPMuIL_012247 [Solemya velum]
MSIASMSEDYEIVDLCDRKTTTKRWYSRVYFMYNGGHGGHVHGKCYCQLSENEGGPDLYWLDVRLHQQAVSTPLVCGTTTLYWGDASHNTSVACLDPYHRTPFMEKHKNKKGRTWVQLHLGEDRPGMVWIMAEDQDEHSSITELFSNTSTITGDEIIVSCRGFEEFQTTEKSPATTPTEISSSSGSPSSQSTMSVTDPGVSPETLPTSTSSSDVTSQGISTGRLFTATVSSTDVTGQGISTGRLSTTPVPSTYVTNRGTEGVTVSKSMSNSTSNGSSENPADGGLGIHWIITLAVLGTVVSTGCVLLFGIHFRRRWRSREHTSGEHVDKQTGEADDTVRGCRPSPYDTMPEPSTRRETVNDYSEIELDTMRPISPVTEERNHIYNHLHQTSPTRSDRHVEHAYSHVRSPGHMSDTYDHLKTRKLKTNLPGYDHIPALRKKQPESKNDMPRKDTFQSTNDLK